jgi:hypothetical protein
LLRDPSLTRRLALAARRRVEDAFTVDVMARRTTGAYLSLVRAKLTTATIAAA